MLLFLLFFPGYRVWLCHELCIPHVSHVIIHLWLWRKIHWLPASNSSVLLWPADCFNGVNSAPRPIAKPSHTPNCDQPDCQLVLKNFTKQVHSFSSNPPGVLPHPKDLACFAMFEKSLLEETQHVSDSSQVMSIQNYPKTYPKTYPKRPTTSTEFPFFSTKHHRLAMDAAPSKRPVADPEGPILELLRVPGRTHRWKLGHFRTAIICELQKNDPHKHCKVLPRS